MAGPPRSCPLGNWFLAALPLQVSLLWTALPPLPVEVVNRPLLVPQSLPAPPTAGAWNGKELGFLKLAGWEAARALLPLFSV